MKKTVLALCLLIALSITAQAQRPHPRYRHNPPRAVEQPYDRHAPRFFNPYANIHFNIYGELGHGDFGAIFRHEIPYHFAIGGMAEYQFCHFTSIGIGAEFLSSYGQHCSLFHNMQETYIHALPIYANLRLTIPHAPVSPFIEGRVGYAIPLGRVSCADPDGVHHYKAMGLYTGAAIGLKIYRVYLSWGISVFDVADADYGAVGPRMDVIKDYYIRVAYAF